MTQNKGNNNKKRKHECSPTNTSKNNDDGHHNEISSLNIQNVLFDEMTNVNSQLISLARLVKLVDNLYFVNNNGTIDEFIGNLEQFVKQVKSHRKKIAFNNLNSDLLSHVFKFVDTNTLLNGCGLVCKLWKESLIGLNVKVFPSNLNDFLNSSLVKSVTQLTIENDSTIKSSLDLLKSLAKCKNFDKLETLDLTRYRSNSKDVQYLAECHMPKLSELLLYQTVTNYNDTLEVLNGKFMSSLKKLDVSNYYSNSLENGDESISESKYSSQLTHLKIINNSPNYLKRVDLLLKDKVNLEHLKMEYYQLSLYPNLLTNGNYLNLTYLDISYCLIGNYELVNLVLSKNLPKLTTLKASNLNCITWGQLLDTTVVEFPSNSQSSLTELDLFEANFDCFPTIIDHCPKLKRLTISSSRVSNIFLSKMLESPNLSNLEYLNIECCTETLEIIFTNRIYSNLNELVIYAKDEEEFEPCLMISDCTNLVNLKTMTIRNIITGLSRKKIKENPLFSNVIIINNHLRYWESEEEDEEDEE